MRKSLQQMVDEKKKEELNKARVEFGLIAALGSILVAGFVGTSLSNQKDKEITYYEQSQEDKTFDISKLLVTEFDNHLYIISNEEHSYTSPCIYEEYHGLFSAFYNLHSNDKENHNQDFCPEYVHIYDEDIKLLIEYLDEDKEKELAAKNGKISSSELEEIEAYINKEYNKNSSLKANKKLKLTFNN